MSIKQLKDENGNPIGWGYEFDDGTLLETGYGRDGVVAAQNIANTTGGNIENINSSAEAQAAIAAANAKANKIAELDVAGITDINGNVVDGETAYNIQQLADAAYLAQTTGISANVYDALKARAGVDMDAVWYDQDANDAKAVLSNYGISSGSAGTGYWENSTVGGPQDAGAKAHYEAVKDAQSMGYLASTVENLEQYAGEIDPSTGLAYQFMSNDNIANAALIQDVLAETGEKSLASSTGRVIDKNTYDKKLADTYDLQRQMVPGEYGAANTDSGFFNALQWKELQKKKETESGYTADQSAVGITGGGSDTTGGGETTGGFTANTNTLGIPDSAVMPTLRPSAVFPGASGNYTVPAQTFESNLTAQETDFKAREAEQAKMYQPQTLQEKQEAGQDTSSYAISQKMYRNPNTGQQIFITFQGSQPLQPIPAGFYEVSQSTGTFGQPSSMFNPVTAGGNTFTGANTGGVIQGYAGEDGSIVAPTPNPIDPSQIYGDVSFTDPVTGQVITQTPAEYFQSLANKQAQATFNPATSVAMSGVSTMAELGYEYNADGTIKTDPTTGAPVTKELMPGTVLESTAGQAQATAPIVTGDQIAQVGDITQARGPGSFDPQAMLKASGNLDSGSPFRWEPSKNKYVLYNDTNTQIISEVNPDEFARMFNLNMADYGSAIPGSAQASLTTAAPGVSQQLQGGTSTDYQGMADAVAGANWDVTTGTFNMNGQTFTPDQFIAANNLSVGDYLTTTGGLQAVTSTGPTKTINAAQQTGTSLTGLTSATSSSTDITGAPTRTLDTTVGKSELIQGTGVDQAQVDAAFGTGEVAAASVQDELAGLMAQFEGGDTPAWAAGSMRKASQMLAARGLGASSMAGQAVIQAAMEAALPIAQIDAGNKQQMALFKAEQRSKFLGQEFDQTFQAKVMNAAKVSEIANMNFSAEQQIALENSKAANTMSLQNLNNKQALIMAEAAALSQMDMANLSNLQQAAVQNAQNFLQIDMANLSNKQSTALFKSQQVTNAMLSDAAQANATAQFNATSENQTNQFMSNLQAQVSQFNAAQQNAINQFNAEEANALLEFNSALQNQREMFNAQNYLVVAQANAQWRQGINTSNTEAQNVANLTYAKEVNGLTQKALDDYWQKERDIMSYAFAQSEGSADRALKILLGEQSMDSIREQLEFKENQAKSEFWSDLLFGDVSFSSVFKLPTV